MHVLPQQLYCTHRGHAWPGPPRTHADPIITGWIGRAIPVFPSSKVLKWSSASGGHLIRTEDPLAISVEMHAACPVSQQRRGRSQEGTSTQSAELPRVNPELSQGKRLSPTHSALSTQNS